jgi:hypothetical protein
MYQIALEKFNDMPFGDNQSCRISPSGVDYPAVFLDADGKPNGVMKVMVAGVMKVLRWINANKDNKDQFHHAGIQKVVQEQINDWKDKAVEQKENGPVKGHANLNNLVYPVSNLGAAKQMSHLDSSERPEMLCTII